jgi:hypothetical protein
MATRSSIILPPKNKLKKSTKKDKETIETKDASLNDIRDFLLDVANIKEESNQEASSRTDTENVKRTNRGLTRERMANLLAMTKGEYRKYLQKILIYCALSIKWILSGDKKTRELGPSEFMYAKVGNQYVFLDSDSHSLALKGVSTVMSGFIRILGFDNRTVRHIDPVTRKVYAVDLPKESQAALASAAKALGIKTKIPFDSLAASDYNSLIPSIVARTKYKAYNDMLSKYKINLAALKKAFRFSPAQTAKYQEAVESDANLPSVTVTIKSRPELEKLIDKLINDDKKKGLSSAKVKALEEFQKNDFYDAIKEIRVQGDIVAPGPNDKAKNYIVTAGGKTRTVAQLINKTVDIKRKKFEDDIESIQAILDQYPANNNKTDARNQKIRASYDAKIKALQKKISKIDRGEYRINASTVTSILRLGSATGDLLDYENHQKVVKSIHDLKYDPMSDEAFLIQASAKLIKMAIAQSEKKPVKGVVAAKKVRRT